MKHLQLTACLPRLTRTASVVPLRQERRGQRVGSVSVRLNHIHPQLVQRTTLASTISNIGTMYHMFPWEQCA